MKRVTLGRALIIAAIVITVMVFFPVEHGGASGERGDLARGVAVECARVLMRAGGRRTPRPRPLSRVPRRHGWRRGEQVEIMGAINGVPGARTTAASDSRWRDATRPEPWRSALMWSNAYIEHARRRKRDYVKNTSPHARGAAVHARMSKPVGRAPAAVAIEGIDRFHWRQRPTLRTARRDGGTRVAFDPGTGRTSHPGGGVPSGGHARRLRDRVHLTAPGSSRFLRETHESVQKTASEPAGLERGHCARQRDANRAFRGTRVAAGELFHWADADDLQVWPGAVVMMLIAAKGSRCSR